MIAKTVTSVRMQGRTTRLCGAGAKDKKLKVEGIT